MMASSMHQTLRGTLTVDEPMSRHTSWRIGGKADRFYTPADIDDLAMFISTLPDDEEIIFMGLGSNMLVRDGGIRGTVISLQGSLSEIMTASPGVLRVGAGASCAKLARYCHRNDLVGGEFFAGIPGLIGGALAMNAGAFGGETWNSVRKVQTIDRYGAINERTPADYVIAYRKITGHKDEWFVSAEFKFESGDGELAAEKIRALLDKRNTTQPTGLPSCGSVFKNPQGDYAARLIEASGLKGYAIGGAVVSEKHANFIINSGNARAEDVEALIHFVQKTVEQKHAVMLETEVKIIGEKSSE